MNDSLTLHIPAFEELEYRRNILSQPETMSYNRGYQLSFCGYNNETGCIEFGRDQWDTWYKRWIMNAPDRYYAYLAKPDGTFIGEVCFHYDPEHKAHCIGIVIEARYRGSGYCREGLILLEKKAFDEFGLEKLRNEIPLERKAAIAGHKKAGFKEINIIDGLCILEITREEYLTSVNY